jgi:hypothetical protein
MAKNKPLHGVQEVFDRALQLAKSSDENFVELGRLLLKLQDENTALFRLAYQQAGIGRRTAYNFAQIARAFQGLPVKDEDLALIGSTRALILAPHIDAQNCGVLLALAATTSARDLRIVADGGEPVAGSKAVVLYLSPAEKVRFNKALLAHGGVKLGGAIYHKEAALMKMIDAVEEAGA